MAAYAINPGTMGQKNVEAEDFRLIDDYWHFYDVENNTVYVAAAEGVNIIELQKQ